MAIKEYQSTKPYELIARKGEKFLVYGEAVTEDTVLLKAGSQRSHQSGYMPKQVLQMQDAL